MVKKIIGYAVALAGVAVLFYSTFSEQIKLPFTIPAILTGKYLMIAGLVMIILGVLFSVQSSKAKQPHEVPIYEGEGKKRTIVGYKRMGK